MDWHPHGKSDKIASIENGADDSLDQRLVTRVDRAARKLGTTRSACTRDALRNALARLAMLEKERRHHRGYEARPAKRGEFDDWVSEQVWPD